jgi:hypothetical protein
MAKLIGTAPNQVPTNGDLGDLAYQNKESVKVEAFESNGIDDNATSTAMTIDSSGQVGIGTDTPNCALKVDGKNSTYITSGWNRTAVFKDVWPTVSLYGTGSDGNTSAGFAYNPSTERLDVVLGGSENDLLAANNGLNRPLSIQTSEVVVNDRSNDCDFRVESNNNSHMLFVDAGNDSVAIGNSSGLASESPTVKAGNRAVFGEVVSNQSIVSNNCYYKDGNSWRTISASPHSNWSALRLHAGSVRIHAGTASAADENISTVMDGTSLQLIAYSNGIVINENSGDNDFRVESNNNSNAFVVDGGLDLVRIGSNGCHTATVLKSGTIGANSSGNIIFDLSSDFGIGAKFNFHFEIDAGAYGNSLSGPGVYKIVGGGYSHTNGNMSTNTIVNQMSGGSWAFSHYDTDAFKVAVTNTTSSDKFVVAKMTITYTA